MNDRAYRYLPIATLGFALLLALPASAAADPSGARGRAAAAAAFRDRLETCGACASAQVRCSADCFGRDDKAGFAACMMACDNAEASCSCDEKVTLRSEDLVAQLPWLAAEKAAACHSTTPCGSAYPSCASWSGYSDCGDPFCGVYRWCPADCQDDFGCWGDATKKQRERFRVCFNAQGQSCTEYQLLVVNVGCGC